MGIENMCQSYLLNKIPVIPLYWCDDSDSYVLKDKKVKLDVCCEKLDLTFYDKHSDTLMASGLIVDIKFREE